jgi:hypothetical protein
MGSLIKLIASTLLATGGVDHLQATITRLVLVALCAALAAVMMLGALGCLAAALWIYTLPSLGPVGAPLVVAAAFLIVTLILVAVACRLRRPGWRKAAAAPAAGASLAPEIARLLKEHKGTVLLAAAIAGMAAASGRRK